MSKFTLVLIILSSILYHNISKNIPLGTNSFLSLAISYGVACIFSLVLFSLDHNNLKSELHNLNWTSFVLGFAIFGIELGYILLYKNGWDISTSSLTLSSITSILLLFIGIIFYRESISLTNFFGVIICLVGLFLIKK